MEIQTTGLIDRYGVSELSVRHLLKCFFISMTECLGLRSHNLLTEDLRVKTGATLSGGAAVRARLRRRKLSDDAAHERRHLHAAVNNMPIGLVMFDAGKRLIVGDLLPINALG